MYTPSSHLDLENIKLYESKKMDLRGAIVFDGFPSVGLVSTIATNYLINVLELEQIGIIDSPIFPALSIIRNGEPLSPVRIYGGHKKGKDGSSESLNIVAFISEFAPPISMIKDLAKVIINFAVENNCKMIITPEGWAVEGREFPELPPGEDEEETEMEKSAKVIHQVLEKEKEKSSSQQKKKTSQQNKVRKVPVYGVGSTAYAREYLKRSHVLPFLNGAITGVSGVLLNEGKKRNRDVICLLAEAHQNYPDARAAASIVDTIDRMLFNIEIDPKPLFEEAEIIESQILMMHSQVKADATATKPPRYMYG